MDLVSIRDEILGCGANKNKVSMGPRALTGMTGIRSACKRWVEK